MRRVDRRRALEMCLTLLEAQMRIASTNFTLLSPREGYDVAWDELREAMEQVREMMREEREREHGCTTD